MLTRRGLITGLISLAAAPAIVRYSSLMPVKTMLTVEELTGTMINQIMLATNPFIHGLYHRLYIENDKIKHEFISDYEFYKGPRW